jgi:hypothetical protein
MKTKITILSFLAICSLNLFSTNFSVTNNADAGAGSLRQAITDANADATVPHTITFNGNYTIALSTALPTVSKAMTIDGGANSITISGYSISGNSLTVGANATLTKITFDRALVSFSTVTGIANNCTFKNGNAGALKASGTFTANSCTFDSNSQSTANSGSAVWGNSSTNVITLNDCVVSNNTSTTGPAIYVSGNNAVSSLTINNSIIKNNSNTSASVYGGGIASSAVMSITNSQISGNTCTYRGAGIAVLVGTATLKSKLTMLNSTVSGNTATGVDGGICIQGTSTDVTDLITLTNCTISGNSTAAAGGGGIGFGTGASGTTWACNIVVNNCTITGNTSSGNTPASIGGGISKNGGTTVSLKVNYSIVAGNNSNSTDNGKDITYVTGYLTSDTGRNLYGGLASWGASTTSGNVNLTADISTILNTTLTDNGGTTALPDGSYVKTHALLAGCSAINPTAASSGLQATDQRGITRSTPDIGAYEYVTYRSKASGNWASTSSWQSGDNSTWSDVTVVPAATVAGSVTIQNGHEITVAANATSPALTINSGAKLTLNAGYTLGVTGNFNIQSDATNGTGTFVDKTTNGGLTVTGTTTVNQSLQAASALRTWYITPPVVATTEAPVTPTPTLNIIKYFDETKNTGTASDNWVSATSMVAKVGYQVVPFSGKDISFSGTLNNGNQNIPLTSRTSPGNFDGFNLIGNPYPSYLDWNLVTANTANTALMRSTTMWYRTKKLNDASQLVYQFWTVNGDGLTSPKGASPLIPPLQAFWVRANAGGGSLALTNAMRSHAPATDFLLKAPAAKNTAKTVVRLQVSNGANTDEAVLYLSANASNGMDIYDSPKMSNNDVGIPEIYTTVGDEQMVINAMNTLPLDTPIGLGFVPGNATSFSLAANEITNLPTDVKVILKDNVTMVETDLSDGISTYQFSPVVTSSDRFSIIFRSAGAVTNVETPHDNSLMVYSNAPQQLTVMCKDSHVGSIISVYNAIGQILVNQQLTNTSTQIAGKYMSGVYIVRVNNSTMKVIVN